MGSPQRNSSLSAFNSILLLSASLAFFPWTCSAQRKGSFSLSKIKSLSQHEKLHANATNKIRIENVDVILDDKGEEIGICHVPLFLPLSDLVRETGEIRPYTDFDTFQGVGAAFLAMQHLNTGDGRIVKEVQGLNERCNIRFTPEVHDSQLSESNAVSQAIDIVSRNPEQEKLPCAFLGAFRSAVSIPLSIITGLKGYPQLSPLSTSAQLDNKNQFPLFGRLIPSDDGTAMPLVKFLQKIDVRNGLAILHTNDAYGNAYALGVQMVATEISPDLNIKLVDIPFDLTPDIVTRKIKLLKDTKFRYFFGVIFGVQHYEPIMIEAYKQEIAGTGLHNWIFGDGLGLSIFQEKVFERNSTLHLATRGISMIAAVGGMAGQPIYDEFVTALGEIDNHHDIEYVRGKLPRYEDSPAYSDYVSKLTMDRPGITSVFMYDSTIALGLAACNVTRVGSYFGGTEHYRAVLESSFTGVSGKVDLNKDTGTRTPSSALFNIFNFVEDGSEGSTLKITAVLSEVFEDGKWKNVNPFIFNDGTTTPAQDLPKQKVEEHYLTSGLLGAGVTMVFLIFMLSVGFGIWTFRNTKSRVVRASQPIFLHLICSGTFLMGSSIIPLGIDDNIASVRGCDIACMAFPWLASTGFAIAFSALFTKTYRVNKIFHSKNFKRVKISALDVMKPMFAHLGVNSIILVLFNVLDPFRWSRDIIAVDEFGRVVESNGSCTSDNSTPYIVPLACVNLGVLIVALYQAYIARHISTEFAESEYIALAMLILLLVSLIGVPVIFLVEGDSQAMYFVISGIISISSLSLLLLIFVPKMISLRNTRRDGDAKKSKDAIRETADRINRHSNASYTSSRPNDDGNSKLVERSLDSLAEGDDDMKRRTYSHLSSVNTNASEESSENEGMKIIDSKAHYRQMKYENRSLRHLTHKLEGKVAKLETINSSRRILNENETNSQYVGEDDFIETNLGSTDVM